MVTLWITMVWETMEGFHPKNKYLTTTNILYKVKE